MKLHRYVNLIFSFLDDAISVTIQFQYYEGKRFVGSRHWGIGFGLCFPPLLLFKGQEDMK